MPTGEKVRYLQFVFGPGWYAIIPTRPVKYRASIGPWRTQEQVEDAMQRMLNRITSDYLDDLRAHVVIGPYRTRAEANAATLADPLHRVPFGTKAWGER